MPSAPIAAAADGLSKLRAPWLLIDCAIIVAVVAGDFLNCCGDDRGPGGEKASCVWENGVETGGVGAVSCDGVLPCCEAACFIGVAIVRS